MKQEVILMTICGGICRKRIRGKKFNLGGNYEDIYVCTRCFILWLISVPTFIFGGMHIALRLLGY